MMIKDGKAESLEARGLYRRAAARWSEVMHLCADDKEREQAKRRCDECLEKAKRPPAKQVVFADLLEAAKETQKRMGLGRTGGEAFRAYKR
ncbi:PerC family transcriptional regulator [Klebsiella pneumoniae]|uniref:PerC family transcriptional regulator n=1 Tax=Klebsiella pneumoniae TaxID=573 RepID=UPI00191A655E|nr:PerC family transcriptional regulator [Klebsiella pneumoniae]MCP6481857.1 PerC family transcriptional regulator [Klebsiella pneumoniae]